MPMTDETSRKQCRQIRVIFSNLGMKYRYIRTHLRLCSEGCDLRLEAYQSDVRRIHRALSKLKPVDSYIITQTFGKDGKVNNRWWRGIYTKSTFYRFREEAVKRFLQEYYAK